MTMLDESSGVQKDKKPKAKLLKNEPGNFSNQNIFELHSNADLIDTAKIVDQTDRSGSAQDILGGASEILP